MHKAFLPRRLTMPCVLAALCVQAEQGGRGNQAGNTHQPPVPAPQQVQLPSHLLVEALNEHVSPTSLCQLGLSCAHTAVDVVHSKWAG